MTRIVSYTSVLMIVVMASCYGNRRHYAPDEMTYQGIDVSSYQKNIDWVKVAADTNVTFAYIKATEGATIIDKYYARNIEQARANGIKVGSYHFFTTTATVRAQYLNFTRRLDAHHQDLIPVIDVEQSGRFSRSQLIDSVAQLARLLENHYGRKPMIYSTMQFYNSYLTPQFNKYPLYIGRYSAASPQIKWNGRALLWQYSDEGLITGIIHHVDLATFTSGHSLDDILIN